MSATIFLYKKRVLTNGLKCSKIKKKARFAKFGGEQMNKKELIAAMAEKAELTQVDAAKALDAFLAVFKETLQAGEGVQITGYFNAQVCDRAAREALNPLTKEKIMVPAKKVVKIKVSKALQEAL